MIASILFIFVTVAILNYAGKDIYDGQFQGNILIVGKTRCGKTFYAETCDK